MSRERSLPRIREATTVDAVVAQAPLEVTVNSATDHQRCYVCHGGIDDTSIHIRNRGYAPLHVDGCAQLYLLSSEGRLSVLTNATASDEDNDEKIFSENYRRHLLREYGKGQVGYTPREWVNIAGATILGAPIAITASAFALGAVMVYALEKLLGERAFRGVDEGSVLSGMITGTVLTAYMYSSAGSLMGQTLEHLLLEGTSGTVGGTLGTLAGLFGLGVEAKFLLIDQGRIDQARERRVEEYLTKLLEQKGRTIRANLHYESEKK